jgi:hypothetical protein
MLRRAFSVIFAVGGCITMLSLYKELFHRNSETVEDPVENIPTIIVVEDINKTIEVESTSFWDFYWSSLTEGQKNFWKVFAVSLIFFVLNALVMQQLFRRYWHRKEEGEHERKKTDRCERLAQELRDAHELLEEVQEKDRTEIWNGTQSIKRQNRKEELFLTDFQSVMEIAKTTNFGDGGSCELQNLTYTLEKNSLVGNECFDEIENVIREMRADIEKSIQMPREQIVVSPEPKESPVKVTRNSISCTVASKAVASEEQGFKKNPRISKIPVRVLSPVRLTDYVSAQRQLTT